MPRNSLTVPMSAHNNWRTWAMPCDWSGLKLMNCKTRAEAFAKRLHSKLRNLGGIGIVELEEEEGTDTDADGEEDASAIDGDHPNHVPCSIPADAADSNSPVAVNGLSPFSHSISNGEHVLSPGCSNSDNLVIVNRFWDENVKMLTIRQPQSASPCSPTDLHSTFNFFGAHMEMNGLDEAEEDAYLVDEEEEEEEEEKLSMTLAQTVKKQVDIGQGRDEPKKDAQLNGTVTPPDDRDDNVCDGAQSDQPKLEDDVALDGKMKALVIHINGGNHVEDDSEDADALPQRVQRSSSLRTCKTPPGTPAAAKKMVRFADALGLDLEDVRTIFVDDLPEVPRSAFTHLSEPSLASKAPGQEELRSQSPWHWVAGFTPPAALPDFRERLVNQKVCLETALALDCGAVHAVVRVLNVHFEKKVIVRLSRDEWVTWSDASASYVPGSCDGFSDKFSVVMYSDAAGGRSLSFAVKYEALGTQYWDNNRGQNYIFRSFPDVPRRHISPAHEDDPWLRFV